MKQLLSIPHPTSHGMCPVNGIRDLVQWRSGLDWSNEFLWGLGQGGGFAYLRFNAVDPPRQVREYLNSPPDLEGNHLTPGRGLIIAFLQQAREIAGVDFSEAVGHFQESISVIPEIAGAIRQNDLARAALGFERVAKAEISAFSALSKAVGTAL
ncbi:MAG TPA: hypothetical protein VMS73_06085 [Anaerolineaceae bacterium]|nr:hypothetical protein [Anaerolineaceae bacterium]